jgi:hypothetical protein
LVPGDKAAHRIKAARKKVNDGAIMRVARIEKASILVDEHRPSAAALVRIAALGCQIDVIPRLQCYFENRAIPIGAATRSRAVKLSIYIVQGGRRICAIDPTLE